MRKDTRDIERLGYLLQRFQGDIFRLSTLFFKQLDPIIKKCMPNIREKKTGDVHPIHFAFLSYEEAIWNRKQLATTLAKSIIPLSGQVYSIYKNLQL